MRPSPGLLLAVIFACLQAAPARSADAAAQGAWPVGLQTYLKKEGNCAATVPAVTPSPGAPALGTAYRSYIREQACRTNNVRAELESAPEKLCPGVTSADLAVCFEKTGLAMSEAGMLDLASVRFLSSGPRKRSQADKSLRKDPVEAAYADISLRRAELALIDKRVRPDQLGLLPDKQMQALLKSDEKSARAYERTVLREWETLLKSIDDRVSPLSAKSPAAAKARLAEAKKEYRAESARLNRPAR